MKSIRETATGFIKKVTETITTFLKNLNKFFGSLNAKGWVVAIVLFFVAIFGSVALLRYIFNPHTGSEAMESLANKYYNEKIVNSAQKSSSYTIVAKNMRLLGYDISEIESYGCSADSYAIIFIDPSTGKINEIATKMSGC
jgi:hypothetical protein